MARRLIPARKHADTIRELRRALRWQAAWGAAVVLAVLLLLWQWWLQ